MHVILPQIRDCRALRIQVDDQIEWGEHRTRGPHGPLVGLSLSVESYSAARALTSDALKAQL